MKTNKKIEKNVPAQVRLKGIVEGYNEEFAGIVDTKGKKYSLRGVLVGEEVEFMADTNGKTTLQKLNSTNEVDQKDLDLAIDEIKAQISDILSEAIGTYAS